MSDTKPRKAKICKGCNESFIPDRSFQVVCQPSCAIEYAKDKARTRQEKKQRLKTKTAREALKTRSDHLRDAQTAFNAYIRERDAKEPCISCGRSTGCKVNAGHYLSVGAHPELRFHELNCNLQCEHCNTHLSGNLLNYRKALIIKIGLQSVEWLEGPHEPLKLTIPQIKEIRQTYKDKVKDLRCSRS